MIVVQLIGGIAIFLYGMKICAEGLKTGTGDWLNKLLGKMTQSKKRSVFFGVIVTMFTQSSGATSIILVSLVNTSLITLVQSLPVLLGAGIGTTLTVQLIAFRIFDYALIFVSLGVFLIFFTKKPNLKTAGEILLGFGLIFYGMKVMSLALEPLKHNPDLTHVLMYFKNNPWLSLITSTLVTAVVQSSGAIIAILIAFAIKGLFGLTTGEEFLILVMPMIFGANLGTCITAFIGSMGASRNAKELQLLNS